MRDLAGFARVVLVLVWVLASAVAVTGCLGGGSSGPSGPASTIPGSAAWHASSTPLAIEYLRTLPDDRIGQPLGGIPLSDGHRWLEGFVYRGVIPVDHPDLHVIALSAPLGEPVTLMWIDEDGQPWPLPLCGADTRGVRARTLSGQVYTWKALRPGSGIVSSECPPADWPPPGPAAGGTPSPSSAEPVADSPPAAAPSAEPAADSPAAAASSAEPAADSPTPATSGEGAGR